MNERQKFGSLKRITNGRLWVEKRAHAFVKVRDQVGPPRGEDDNGHV
jgi:hypothetical protein